MDKKTLKNYINENGFFLSMKINKIEANDATDFMKEGFSENAFNTGMSIPAGENIIVFKGLASQAYGKGEKSRNGYKIDPKGWDFNNYGLNPIILKQHDDSFGGIGHAIKFEVTPEGLNILFYVDLNTLDTRTAYQVKNGFINAISTGHITREDGIEENETGIVYSIGDAIEKFGMENVRYALCGDSELYTYIVTKAEAVENSLVTIGSNEKAIAMPNAIGSYAQNKYADIKTKMSNGTLKKNDIVGLEDNEADEVEDEAEKTEEEAEKEVVNQEEEKTVEVEAKAEESQTEEAESSSKQENDLEAKIEVKMPEAKENTEAEAEAKVEGEAAEVVEEVTGEAKAEEATAEAATDENKKKNEEDDEEEKDPKEVEADKKKNEVEEGKVEGEESLAKEEEVVNTEDKEAEDVTEQSSENAAEMPEGVKDVQANNVQANKIEEMQKTINDLNIANNKLSEENKLLKNEILEKDGLLEQGQKMIESQNKLVTRALNYQKKQGLAFSGNDENKVGKSALEGRMRFAQ